MRRHPRLTALGLPFALALLLAAGLQPLAIHAQDSESPTPTEVSTRPKRVRPNQEGLLLFALVDQLPEAPSFVRLLRINLAPGAKSPLHFHPGPEVGLVESGVSTAQVEGPSDLLPAGRTKPIAAPEGEEFEMERGDQVLFRQESPQTFRNAQTDGNTSILSAVILPAGHQHPPGLTWVNGTPGPNALEGVTSTILGDGVAYQLPTGPAAIVIERLVLEEGEPIPASNVPTLLSLESGVLDFTVTDGLVQVSRSSAPGPQADAKSGDQFSMGRDDAAFFPYGNEEVERPSSDGELTLLRLSIVPVAGEATAATPAASPVAEAPEAQPPAVIEISEPPTPTPPPTAAATPTAVAEETPATTDGSFAIGDIVFINETDVRLRSAPSLSADFIGVDQGAEFTIIDGPVEADGIVWWGVASNVDPSITGWVAGQFISHIEPAA